MRALFDGRDPLSIYEQRDGVTHLQFQADGGFGFGIWLGNFIDDNAIGLFDPSGNRSLFDKANKLLVACANRDDGRAGDHVLLRGIALVSVLLLPAHDANLHRRGAVSLILDPQFRGVGVCSKPGIDGPEQDGGRRLRLASNRHSQRARQTNRSEKWLHQHSPFITMTRSR